MNTDQKNLRDLEIMRRRQEEISRAIDMALQRARELYAKIQESAKRRKPVRTK